MNNAIILTNGLLKALDAKTAHGLIRGTERFTIKGVVDYALCAYRQSPLRYSSKFRPST